MSEKKWVVYLVRCSDKSLYCGTSNDFKSRMIEHNSGTGAKYIKSRRPVELVSISTEMTKIDALKLEYRIKQLQAGQKISDLKKEGNKMTIKRNLQALNREMKSIEKKLEKLVTAIEKSEKPKGKVAPS